MPTRALLRSFERLYEWCKTKSQSNSEEKKMIYCCNERGTVVQFGNGIVVYCKVCNRILYNRRYDYDNRDMPKLRGDDRCKTS